MVSKLPTDLMSVLPWVTGLALAAIPPLPFTCIMDRLKSRTKRYVSGHAEAAPARHGVNGCIISGLSSVLSYGLMPLWLNHQGVSDAGIGFGWR